MANKNGIYELSGVLYSKEDTRNYTTKAGNPFNVRNFIVETRDDYNGKTYTQIIGFTAIGDMTSKVEDIAIGSEVKVSFVIQGKMVKKKDGGEFHKTELKAIGIDVMKAAAGTEAPDALTAAFGPEAGTDDDSGDLPF